MQAGLDQDTPSSAFPRAAAREEHRRMCVLTRQVHPVGELLRFVAAPDGALLADVRNRLPGRGVWVTAARWAVAEAARKGLFARGLRRTVSGADAEALGAATDQLLARAALDALSIAAKAGLVLTGFSKVEAGLRQGPLALLHAAEAAPDGMRKLDGAARRIAAEGGAEPRLITLFSGDELDLALGRPHVIHAAVLAGPASDTFLTRASRLDRYRTARPLRTRADGKAPEPAAER